MNERIRIPVLCVCSVVTALAMTACTTRPETELEIPEPAPVSDSDERADRIDGLTQKAREAYERGEFAMCVKLLMEELQRAWILDNSSRIAWCSKYIGASHLAMGNYDEAGEFLVEARSEYAALGGDVEVANCLLLEALAYRAKGEREKAVELLDTIQAYVDKGEDGVVASRLHVLRASLACDEGDSVEARIELGRALRKVRRLPAEPPREELAMLALTAGRVHALEGDFATACHEFDLASTWYQRCGRHQEMNRALRRAGEAYLEVRDLSAAADRFFRAGRSAYALGQFRAAESLLRKAIEAADEANDRELRARIARVLEATRDSARAAADRLP